MYAKRVPGEFYFGDAGVYLVNGLGRRIRGVCADQIHIWPGLVGEGHFASFLADDAGIQGYFLIEEKAEK